MIASGRPSSIRDLSSDERQFLAILRQLVFGYVESVRIRRGAPLLDPPPTVIQVLKFGAAESEAPSHQANFELKKSMGDFFEYIRGVEEGEIRRLEVRHGLPFSMEIVSGISRGMPTETTETDRKC